MESPNYPDSEESFDGFDSDDINDCHDRAIVIGESDIDISSIGSFDDDDASSQSDIESPVENNNQGQEQLVTCNSLWTTHLILTNLQQLPLTTLDCSTHNTLHT